MLSLKSAWNIKFKFKDTKTEKHFKLKIGYTDIKKRERYNARETENEKMRGRETDRQTEKHKYRYKDRWRRTDGHTDRLTKRRN